LRPSFAEKPADLVDEASPNAQFIVAVVAPGEAELRSMGRSTSRYGRRGSQWRPFAGASAARQVATIAERLGLPTDIVDLPEGTAQLHTHPTILLIDPWIMALRDGRELLSSVLTEMEAWVTPVVVTDADDPDYADRGERLFRDALKVLDTRHDERAAAQGINHVETFVSTMPRVIDQTRGSFLRNGPTYAPPGPPKSTVFKDHAHDGSGETE
jgi:FxsC-like protein